MLYKKKSAYHCNQGWGEIEEKNADAILSSVLKKFRRINNARFKN